MKIALFVNDSYFSSLLARPLLERFHDDVKLAIFSTRTKGSARRVWSVFRKTYLRYFAYRTFVQAFPRLKLRPRPSTVRDLVAQFGISSLSTSSVERLQSKFEGFDLGVAINFDQVFDRKVIECFGQGIINLHASRLPEGRGISPALWAFASGAKEIWISIYRMDPGVDTGPLLRQFPFEVQAQESFFSLYERLCLAGGRVLSDVVEDASSSSLSAFPQPDVPSTYASWPDRSHSRAMRANEKKFFRLRDFWYDRRTR
jgi:methionyl-tRNA formyltransferase